MKSDERCPVCGIKRVGNYNFCPRCGNRFENCVDHRKYKVRTNQFVCERCRWYLPDGEERKGTCVHPTKVYKYEEQKIKKASQNACKKHFEEKENETD